MIPEDTLQNLKKYCQENSGSPYVWNGATATYSWRAGKTTRDGILNGVVRKAQSNNADNPIWNVAGSFKILPDGSITRFTGLPVVVQRQCSSSQ